MHRDQRSYRFGTSYLTDVIPYSSHLLTCIYCDKWYIGFYENVFRQYFALDIQPDQLPTNHGATLVANTAFATVGVIGVILLIPSIILGEHPLVVGALLVGIVGALNGYLLWKRGHIVLSTTLHAGGLVFIGWLAFGYPNN